MVLGKEVRKVKKVKMEKVMVSCYSITSNSCITSYNVIKT